jgi:DNA mismatch repair ATPase MutS
VALGDGAVRSTLDLSGHILCTGPNRGGKSSVLRGTLQAVLCAQSFGAVWGVESARLGIPYRRIYTRLVATDMPGKKSLFESDVAFAIDVLDGVRGAGAGPSLVLIDELFHSTNPRDAEASAAYFLRQLWKEARAHTLISTHMFGLLERRSPNVMALCVPARRREDGSLEYSYSVKPGVCMESSVAEVWASVSTEAGAAS